MEVYCKSGFLFRDLSDCKNVFLFSNRFLIRIVYQIIFGIIIRSRDLFECKSVFLLSNRFLMRIVYKNNVGDYNKN